MTAAGKTHSGSIAERAIALLKANGLAMRGGEIADALDVPQSSIVPCLKPHVENGTLVACLVLGKKGKQTYEYRISAGGKGPNTTQYRPPKTPFAAAPAHEHAQAGERPASRAKPPKSIRATHPAVDVILTSPGSMLELTDSVPNPGLRFGKEQIYRNTLLAMKGDASFTVKDATQVYPVAKKLGIKITTRHEGDQVRVWRVS